MSDSNTNEGFVVLNVKYKTESSVVRHLFMKEHDLNETNPSKPIGKTLLVMNIPPFVDQYCIRHLFQSCGKIVDIFFHSTPTTFMPKAIDSKFFDKPEEICGYKVCYVVFTSHQCVKKAIKLSKRSEPLTLKPDSDQHIIGLKAMKQKYNDSIFDLNELKIEINSFMSEYDKQIEEERFKAKESDGVPDEDGWIKVNRYSKRKHLPNDYSNDQKIVENHNKRRKKKTNDLNNFYSFKQKESKIEYLLQLRNKFEDDKKRIAIMKAQRKFKPI